MIGGKYVRIVFSSCLRKENPPSNPRNYRAGSFLIINFAKRFITTLFDK